MCMKTSRFIRRRVILELEAISGFVHSDLPRVSILSQDCGILVAHVFYSKLTRRLLAMLIVAPHHTMLKAKQDTVRRRF